MVYIKINTNTSIELRNMVYEETLADTMEQAMLVYRPRIATLRSRTRQARGRPLPAEQLDIKTSGRELRAAAERESSRPYCGLTQVSRQVRHEYLTWYLERQEVCLDLADIVKYASVFYDRAQLDPDTAALDDAPWKGYLTIAISDTVKPIERGGLELWPLLDLFANSENIRAAFGRYLRGSITAPDDGEGKDLCVPFPL